MFLVGAALAQTSTMTCYTKDQFTKEGKVIDSEPVDVCQFSNGSVHTTLTVGDYTESKWYTRAQWKAFSLKQAAIEKELLQDELVCRQYLKEFTWPPSNLNCARPLAEFAKSGPPHAMKEAK